MKSQKQAYVDVEEPSTSNARREDRPQTEPNACKYDVYIVCDDEDLAAAVQLLNELERYGFSCILGERDFINGRPLFHEIESAVESSRYVVLLMSKDTDLSGISYELLASLGVMYEKNRALIVPVLTDIPESEVPKCLKRLPMVNMKTDPNYKAKLIKILQGPDVGLHELMPAGNVAHGLVWNFYLNYLKFILPDISKRIDKWCEKNLQCLDARMSRKLYILVPASCFCYKLLSLVDETIEFGGHLEDVIQTQAGSVDRVYRHSVWNIKRPDGEVLHFVGEYATVIHTLYEMESLRIAGIDSVQRQIQCKQFLTSLRAILTTYGHTEAEVKFFHDTDSNGKIVPLSSVLGPLVKAHRQPPHAQLAASQRQQGAPSTSQDDSHLHPPRLNNLSLSN